MENDNIHTEEPAVNETRTESDKPKEMLTIQVEKPKKKTLFWGAVAVIAAIILACNLKHCYVCDKLVLFPHKMPYTNSYVCNEHWAYYKKSQEAAMQMYNSILDGATEGFGNLFGG